MDVSSSLGDFPCPVLLHVDSRLMDQHILFGLLLPLGHSFPTH